MSKSMMVSWVVISLVVAVMLVRQVNDAHYTDTGNQLFRQYNVNDNTAYATLKNRMANFAEDKVNNTVQTYLNPSQQPTGTGILVWIDQAIKAIQGIKVVFDIIYYSTIGFGDFINGLFFTALSGRSLIGTELNWFLTAALCFNHFLSVMSWIRGDHSLG